MIVLHYGSGSGPAWRVWLSLEHKQLPYEVKVHSFQQGDLKKPEFLALNPRGKVPTIEDDGFVLYESVAIVEYLEQRYPASGSPLFPRDAKRAAIVRRIVQEADSYLAPTTSRLSRATIMRRGDPDANEIAEAKAAVASELEKFAAYLGDDFFGGALSASDFAVYPMLALVRRVAQRMPEHAVSEPPRIAAWAQRLEALPYLQKTWPPHWK